ncbi:hypothetical protein [Candidatus Amarolinea dominans]|uniref:hypothetical protein n=1 Tax=Candidatus Amarolinea dominans TaxID=3140696 RepID=UPI001DA20562|nr:hypothetical protein [Anaerolineae bacterium]
MRFRRSYLLALLASLIVAIPAHAAASTPPDAALVLSIFSSALALLLPIGLTLLVAGGLEPEQARQATLTLLAAVGLAVLSYWAVGFALQFGGIGLVDSRPGFDGLVWEWSALNESWGTGWGMAGLSGFGLLGAGATADAYLLFLSRLPWVITAALIPLLALRGRAPAPVTLVGGLLSGGLLYPLTGNWSAGGGWLAHLGRNLGLGHGLVDFANAGPVFLVGAAAALAGMLIFLPRHARRAPDEIVPLPPVHLPLLTITGAGLLLVGAVGWALSNPLLDWAHLAPALAAVDVLLAGAGGALLPIAYTWFATGHADPLMAARGLAPVRSVAWPWPASCRPGPRWPWAPSADCSRPCSPTCSPKWFAWTTAPAASASSASAPSAACSPWRCWRTAASARAGTASAPKRTWASPVRASAACGPRSGCRPIGRVRCRPNWPASRPKPSSVSCSPPSPSAHWPSSCAGNESNLLLSQLHLPQHRVDRAA